MLGDTCRPYRRTRARGLRSGAFVSPGFQRYEARRVRPARSRIPLRPRNTDRQAAVRARRVGEVNPGPRLVQPGHDLLLAHLTPEPATSGPGDRRTPREGCRGARAVPAGRLTAVTGGTMAEKSAPVLVLRRRSLIKTPSGVISSTPIGQCPVPYGRLSELLGRVLMLRASRREDRKRVPRYSSTLRGLEVRESSGKRGRGTGQAPGGPFAPGPRFR